MATLAQSTDVLVIGDTYFEEEARKYTERAELNGTIVINEVQFEDLLEHGHLHIEEKASPIGESIELTESIAHIRSLLGDAPTVETWQQLYQVLDKTPKSNLPDVVEYVLARSPLLGSGATELTRVLVQVCWRAAAQPAAGEAGRGQE